MAKSDPRNEERAKKRGFHPFAFIWGIFRGLSTFIGMLILIAVIIGAFASSSIVREEALSDRMILTLHLKDGLIEQESTKDIWAMLKNFGAEQLTVQDMISTVDKAAKDPHIKALAVSIDGGDYGVSNVQELRAVIKRFRASGKPAWVYSASYAEAGGTMGAYYLASAFDQIWMQPVGEVALPGFDASMPFAQDALLKIGVQPQFFQRKEYKSVMENLSRNHISPENKEMMESLLTDIAAVITNDVAADRNLLPQQIVADIEKGVLTDQEALNAKLVDHVDYGDVLIDTLRKSLGGNPDNDDIKLTDLADYEQATSSEIASDKMTTKPKIGLISAVGEIAASDGGSMGSTVVTPDDISSAFEDAIKDKDIKAVVFRITSPGGSPTASETIRRSVERTIAKGKPVIVSMGSMAGSGGYWIATDATRIFAMPATLTGSIGVAGGKMDISGLLEKLSINWEGVQIGKNADIGSFAKPFSETGTERMNASMDSIYNGFTARVAKGRKLSPEAVEKIAKGRVWTGHQALGLGLVDELGGLDAALNYTAKLAGAVDQTKVEVVDLPLAKTPVQELLGMMNIKVMMNNLIGVVMNIFEHSARQAATTKVSVYDPFLDSKL